MAPPKQLSLAGLTIGLVGVALVTAAFRTVLSANASTAGFTFLLVVLGVATASGFRAAAAVSVAAMLCFNYFFLPPLGRFTIADPENWVALLTFLVTALVASHLSDRVKRQAEEARRRQVETEQLYALSRAILLTNLSSPMGVQIAHQVSQIFDSPLVMIFDAKTRLRFHGGAEETEAPLAGRLEEVARLGSPQRHGDVDLWPIALGGRPIGALAAKGIHASDGAVQSMLNLVAIALERVHTVDAANKAEIARQNEELKSTLLDAIAHEFKTPLTSIKAAVTGMPATSPEQSELAAIIAEETERLSRLVTEAVQMAEIDAGKIKPRYAAVDARELLRSVRRELEGRGAAEVEVCEGGTATVRADPELLGLAIRQVVDNALKYAPSGSRVRCSAERNNSHVVIRIADEGPGIPEVERERIFEKFYRRPEVKSRIPGTGLGLHIAREIARLHHGDLWVEPEEGRGAVFCFSLPAGQEGP